MSDVFISYAREDQATVRALNQALAARGRETWVDWEGIAPSDEWLTSILEAIDDADAVVCVLSPDWLASPICRREAEHAIAANKRLVPVVARAVPEGADVPDAIASLNWIFARSDGEIDGAADRIVEAFESDLEAIRVHTLVHARSKAWELAGRRRSNLLRGHELQRAESWVARAAAGTRPHPTELQAAFVAASRTGARLRMRAALAGSVLVAVVSAVLAVLALVSRSQAIHQTRVAVAQSLTEESAATLPSDPELALLLAQQALRHDDAPAARLAFVTALDRTKVRRILAWGGPGGANAVAWSPKGSLVAVAGQNGAVALWRPSDDTVVRRLTAGHPGADAVAFSPDGTLLASAGSDGLVHLWGVADGKLRRSCSGHTATIDSIAFSAGGEAVVTGADDGTVRIWQASNCRQVAILPDGGEVNGIAVAPGDRFVATANRTTGLTRIWVPDKRGWVVARTARAPLSAAPLQVAISPNGKLVATSGTDGAVRVWSWETEAAPTVFARTGDLLVAIAFSPDGTLLASAGDDTRARLWDAASGRLVETLPGNRGLVDSLAFSPDGSSIVTAGSDGTARVYHVSGGIGALEAAIVLPTRIPSMAVGPTGSIFVASSFGLATAGTLGAKHLWDRPLPTGFAFGVTAFDASGASLAGMLDRRVDVLDAQNGRIERSFSIPRSLAMAFAGDGSRVAVSGEQDAVRVYDAHTGKLEATDPVPVALGNVYSLAFSPDGDRIAVGMGGDVLLLDAVTGKETARLKGPAAPIYGLAFAGDGELLAAASADKRAWLWNTTSATVVRTFQGHTGAVTGVAISPDGALLATAGADETARIWNISTGDELRVLTGDSGQISSVGFSPDGAEVVTSSLDRTVRIWDSCAWCRSAAELEAHARPALARCLTPDELDVYLHEKNGRREPCAV